MRLVYTIGVPGTGTVDRSGPPGFASVFRDETYQPLMTRNRMFGGEDWVSEAIRVPVTRTHEIEKDKWLWFG